MNKLYPNLVRAVVAAIQQIFNEKRYADKVIEKILKSNKKWGARDRAFIAESVYEIVRWWRLLLEISGVGYRATPQHFEEATIWQIFGTWWLYEGRQLPNWVEFERINSQQIQRTYDRVADIRKIIQSIPDWLDELGEQALKDRWEIELEASNQLAQVVLRTNTLKTKRVALQKALYEAGIDTYPVKDYPAALVLKERHNVFGNELFKKGFFEIQDAGSQAIAEMLAVQPGMRVIDACAGAGGKTLHLAALMENRGRIIALDVVAGKLQALRKRARRAGVSIIEARPIDNNKVIKRLTASADRLLLDVPCSGLGVLRRNPDAKWKLSPDFITQIQQMQASILT
ncbi:MAG: class I SAM-dependent methyltransferase, partial [Bacteroidota bacterium]